MLSHFAHFGDFAGMNYIVLSLLVASCNPKNRLAILRLAKFIALKFRLCLNFRFDFKQNCKFKGKNMNFVNFLQKGVNFYVNFKANFAFLGVIFAVVLAFVGCGILNDGTANSANSNLSNPQNSTQSWIKSVIKKSPESDIVKQLRGNEKRKAIHQITQSDMRNIVRDSNFGAPPNFSMGGINKYNMQAYEQMFAHRADIIATLREAGYNQTQIAAAYKAAFVEWSHYCEHALGDFAYKSSVIKGLEGHCGYYESEFKGILDELKASGVRDEFGRGINYHYAEKEVPKLVAAEYDKTASDEDLHDVALRLKRLGDRDLGVNLKRKARLDAMVDGLSLGELAGILSDENAAIAQLKADGLTQEQASIVMGDVFFRYANQCERAKNTVSAECELYFKHYVGEIPVKFASGGVGAGNFKSGVDFKSGGGVKERDYLGYSRSVMPYKVAKFYAENASGAAAGVKSSGFASVNSSSVNAAAYSLNSQKANEGKSSWQQVFEIVSQLAGVAKFALQFL